MRLRVLVLCVIGVVVAGAAFAAPKAFQVLARTVKGKPALEVDKAVAYFLWVDEKGVHLRWTTDGKPYLFSGRIDTDRPLKELKRVRETGSGWAMAHGDRIVMFSTTSRGNEDGIDLAIPGARTLQIELKIDANPATPEQVFLGASAAHPGGLPLLVNVQ